MIVQADLRTDEEVAQDSATVRGWVAGWYKKQHTLAARIRGEVDPTPPAPPKSLGEAWNRRQAANARARAAATGE